MHATSYPTIPAPSGVRHRHTSAEQASPGEERQARQARQAEARARVEAVRRAWAARVASGAVRLPPPPERLVA